MEQEISLLKNYLDKNKKEPLNKKLNNLELKTFTERIKNEAANKEISRIENHKKKLRK